MTRREVLGGAAAVPLVAAPPEALRLAICSETFKGAKFPEICAAAKRTGYAGLEIDPANLGPDPALLPSDMRAAARRAMADAELAYVGLHSFMKTPPGMHLTSYDDRMRNRSWDYFARLIDLAADLGPGAVMVLGSSKQREAIDGTTAAEATKRLEEGLARMAPLARQRGVTILLEPLAPHLCNVVNTLEEATTIVSRINDGGLSSMFDTHNTAAESLPPAALITRYRQHIRHLHMNEMDGRYPGAGNYPFAEVLRAARDAKLDVWVSVEVFDFQPDGETVARRASEYLRSAWAKLTAPALQKKRAPVRGNR